MQLLPVSWFAFFTVFCFTTLTEGQQWTKTLVGDRLKSQQVRLAALKDRIDRLVQEVDNEPQHRYDIKAVANDLEKRIEWLEGNDCANENYISCGRNSGQCVHELFFCDSHADCESGLDESDEMCVSPVPPGKTWSGYMNITGGLTKGGETYDYLSLTITSNTRSELLPSRLHVTATWAWVYSKTEKSTWLFNCDGVYSYGKRQLSLLSAPEYSQLGFGREFDVCEDFGEGVMYCRMYNEGDLSQYASAVMGVVQLER